jgi:3-methylcrotonyl-CoA carboxylase beta subunit
MLKSTFDHKHPFYLKNHELYLELLDEYYHNLQTVSNERETGALQKHRERGKLTARERIELLLDSQSPFLELSPLAAWNQYSNNFPQAGIITGIGFIQGKACMIVANDATVKGGTYVKETLKKHLRALEIAEENKLPCINLVDSGGVFLPAQSQVFPDKDDFGRIFYKQARISATGIPQISVVMGSCTAGGAYIPAMSDETIIVRNQGTIFIGGPPLVKAATGEEVTAEALGGAEVHTSISGVADYLAENDHHALEICKNIVKTFPNEFHLKQTTYKEPCYPAEELYGIAALDLKKQVSAHEIIARLVDGSEFQEFKQEYGKELVTGIAHIQGNTVGIIANNGFLTPETSLKGAHFIELCCFRKIPLLFLQNSTGFIVGKSYEHRGIARDGAKMIQAVANASVPKITLITGGSYGAANYAMSGRGFQPRFLFMWPNAKIAVMGGEQAESVLYNIKSNPDKKSGENLKTQIERESSAWYSTSRLWDDGIIDPKETRNVLGFTLSVVSQHTYPEPNFGIFRM